MSTLPSSWVQERQPDVVVALVGLILGLALLPLWLLASSIYLLTIPVVLAAACSLYLVSVRHSATFATPRWTVGANGAVAAELVGIGLVATTVAAFLAGSRTVPVLLLAGAVGALILLQIVFLDDDQLSTGLILAQVLVHAVVVRFTGLLTTPGVIGVDSWTHLTEYAATIREAGSLAPISGVKYFLAPFHHLATVAGAEILGVDLRTGLYLVVGLTAVLSLVLVYATARYFVGVRWALFATAAFAMADQAIRWGMHVIPTSLGLVFFLGVVFAVVRILHAETGWADWALLVGSIVAITLTHQLSAFVSLVFVGAAVLAQVLVGRLEWLTPAPGGDRTDFAADGGTTGAGAAARGSAYTVRETVPLHGAFAFHLLFTGGIWLLTPWKGEPFLTRAVDRFWVTVSHSAGFLNLAGSDDGGGTTAAVASESSGLVSQLAPYVDALGFLLLLFVAVVGSLALLRRHRSPQGAYTLVLAIAVMLVFAFVLPLFGIRNFLPGRWYVFAYVLMAVVGAAGLRHVGDHFSTRAIGVLFVVVLLAYPLAMVGAQKATLDDPTFDDEWTRYSYTESELAGMETIGEIIPAGAERVYTDHPYRSAFTRSGAHPGDTLDVTAVDDPDPPYRRVVYRTYQSEGAPQFVAGDAVVTTQISQDRACPSTRNLVFANGQTRLCSGPDV